jgi:hypothetical protein
VQQDNERRRREAIAEMEGKVFDSLMEKKPSEMTDDEKGFFFAYARKNA